MNTPRTNYEIALAGIDIGKRFIPCRPGEKVPLVKWKQFREAAPTAELYERWFKDTRNGIALLTDGMVLFDCDDPEKVRLVLEHCGDTPHRIRTPRGGEHLGYRRRKGVALGNQVRVRGLPIDIRTDGGLELWPHSWTADGSYAFLDNPLVPLSELPVARIGWTRTRTRRRVRGTLDPKPGAATSGRIVFPERYCLKIESVQGQNGSRALVRVVCVLRDAGRTRDQIFDFVKHVWGPACCRPAWSDKEIRHCIERYCTG